MQSDVTEERKKRNQAFRYNRELSRLDPPQSIEELNLGGIDVFT